MTTEIDKHLERAKRYLERNKTADAIEAYQAVLDLAPSHQEAMQALGDLYTRQNEPERAALYYGLLFDRLTDPREETKALAVYSRFLKSVTQPAERVARCAFMLQKQGRVEEAVQYYAEAAELYLARRNEEEAVVCWERIAQLEPDNPERHLQLGELAERLGKPAAAARGFLRAGQLAAIAGDLDHALSFYARAHRLTPNERGCALLYASAQLRKGDAPAAVQLLDPFAAIESDPVFLDTYGEALMRAGHLDRARATLEQLYRGRSESYPKLFDLAGRYLKAQQQEQAVQVLGIVKQRMFEEKRHSEFALEVDRLAEAFPSSARLVEFWAALYGELNRESKYFDVLVRLFDLYLETGNVNGAGETLERLVDIDPYDFRNQERLEKLKGRVDAARLRALASRLAMSATQSLQAQPLQPSLSETPQPLTEEARSTQALEDLIVQAEIFLQYSLQGKAVERLQKIVELFPGVEDQNERLRNLFDLAHWWPEGLKRKKEAAAQQAPASTTGTTGRTGVYSAETLRDLAKISEINQSVYRQPTPRAMLTLAVNEVGAYLRATRCLAVVGAPGQPPQMAAEFSMQGLEASNGPQIVRLLSQFERAAPDSLGGLPLDAAAAPVLRELGLETALGVQLMDREIQAPAGMLLVGHADPRRWKPNETYFLQAIGDQMLFSLSHTRLRTLVRRFAVADERTGLLARSSYQDCLLSETNRAKTQGTPLALAILQLDRGPDILHQFGEAMVEQHMEQVARALQPLVRQNDLAVKYTTWALAFILPDTTLTGARNLTEKLQKAAAGVLPPWEDRPATVSGGIAQAITRPDFDSEDIVTDLVNRVESSLDEARKRGGATIVSLDISRA